MGVCNKLLGGNMREDMKVLIWNVNKWMLKLASVTYQDWEMTLSVNYRWSAGKVQLWRAFKEKSSASHLMWHKKKSQQWDDEGIGGNKITTWYNFCNSMMKGRARQFPSQISPSNDHGLPSDIPQYSLWGTSNRTWTVFLLFVLKFRTMCVIECTQDKEYDKNVCKMIILKYGI